MREKVKMVWEGSFIVAQIVLVIGLLLEMFSGGDIQQATLYGVLLILVGMWDKGRT